MDLWYEKPGVVAQCEVCDMSTVVAAGKQLHAEGDGHRSLQARRRFLCAECHGRAPHIKTETSSSSGGEAQQKTQKQNRNKETIKHLVLAQKQGRSPAQQRRWQLFEQALENAQKKALSMAASSNP